METEVLDGKQQSFKERQTKGTWGMIIAVLAIGASVFHLWVSGLGMMMALKRNAIHLSFILSLGFLLYPGKRGGKPSVDRPSLLDGILALGGASVGLYIYFFWDGLAERGFVPTPVDLVFGAASTLLVLEATRRVVGNILLGLGIFFLIYVYFGPYFPGIFAHAGMPLKRILFRLYLTEEGFFGIALTISSTFIFFFVLFGAFLQRSGASDLFNKGTLALVGHKQGGPGLVAVISSAFMGMISGSPISNVVTTGSLTIPLMKKVGYPPSFAGAVETAASSGGTIMPPVMGFAAFLMAGILDVPYRTIMFAAILPAIFYYILVFLSVVFEAKRRNLGAVPRENMPQLKEVLKTRGHLLIPIVVLVYLLMAGHSPLFSAWWSIVAIVGSSYLRWDDRMRLKDILWALESGARLVIPVAIACAVAGIVIGSTTMTGIAQTITYNIVKLSQGVTLYALVFIMLATLVMSMALPISACYITVVVLAAPALISMGIGPIVAHFFVLWFASLSGMTPPVALTSYSAASIAGASPNRTSFIALRIVGPAFLLPYLFVYNPSVLLQGNISPLGLLISISKILFCILGVSFAFKPYLFVHVPSWQRFLFIVGSVLLVGPTEAMAFGYLLIGGTAVLNWRMGRKKVALPCSENRREKFVERSGCS